MKSQESKIKQYEPGPEVKAFIFQQIQSLEPMLGEVGSMGVFVEKIEKPEKPGIKAEAYAIRLVVAPGGARIEARGESDNIYDACIKAKDLMVQRLSPFVNAARQSAERDSLIRFFSGGGRFQ
ncbi:MAG: hypothetical protein IPK68_17435 [Bdellovibrionales bacterium]|nr:hypothetical protein [Bdellovibrionales bacterium]